ncbi:siderophore-interacting protein [Actinoplanes sp. CA-142083]|uniref:siderophore-interacting protein n=1 Tax=Actinoplanes sp. CA-142083 TaxID=3239903 RepID=UPI003D8D7B13
MPHVPDELVRRLADTCVRGDLGALEALLHGEAVAHCDGGGQVLAALQPVHGPAGIARLILALLSVRPGVELTVESVNGRAGLALRQDGTAVAVIAVAAQANRITTVWIVLNPVKLHGWHRPR